MKNNTPLIIPVSFKNTQEDIELYNWVCKKQYKSTFIKMILTKVMKEELYKNNQ